MTDTGSPETASDTSSDAQEGTWANTLAAVEQRAQTDIGRRAMRARAAVATSLAGGRTVISRLSSMPPLTLRQTGPQTVYLVSTAAGPLGGDRLDLDLDIAPGTSLEVGSVAGTLVLPGSGESVMAISARVGAGAALRFAPQPTVLAAGCAHRLVVRLTLAAGARAFWREEIVFGRYGEAPGRCHARFDATYDGRPLLRQEYTVGGPAIDASPAVYGDARCIGTTLITPPPATPPVVTPSEAASEAVVAEGVAVLPLAGPGVLVSALATDAVALRRRLEWGEGIALGSLAGAARPT
ncbi:urease accessory protein UreD [Nonomuraea aurantiaca]|uniref:urease accessory protein UreD n=1 Tax=Nonomuraea aurantiaca TaxID=2878562 RepID=UPI001CDA2BEC|nr:urease accessory protein UreD [Nonomuraea aurantiaca]MCA2221642.1 urease accessory protein UreD [Nonomuraea aurantiaca]